MKIAVIGDIHVNSDNYKLVNKLLHKVFDGDYDAYVFLGDIFDAHYVTKRVTIAEVVKYVEEPILRTDKPVIILAGNHDKKNDNYPSSINLVARNRSNVYHFDKHGDLLLGNVYMAFLPYLFRKEPLNFDLPNDKLKLCFLHSYVGDSPFGDQYVYSFDELKDFDEVFAGHYHISDYPYCGILLQNSFKDSECKTGYVVYDTDKREREFIELESRKFIILDSLPTSFSPDNFYKIKTDKDIDEDLPENVIVEKVKVKESFKPREEVNVDDIYNSVIKIGGSKEVAELISTFKVKNASKVSSLYIKELNIENIGSIASKKLNFERGKTYALVAPNKSGKTFILDSISFALIDTFVSRPGSKYNKIKYGKRGGRVELSLSNGLVIDKEMSRDKKSVGSVYSNGEAVCGPNISDVNEYLSNLVSPQVYKNIIHTDQFEYNDIVRMPPAERKEFLFELIGIKDLLKMRDEFKDKYKELHNKYIIYKERIDVLTSNLLDDPQKVKGKVRSLKNELEELKSKRPPHDRKELEKTLKEYEKAYEVVKKAKEDKEFLEKNNLSLEDLTGFKEKLWNLQKELGDLSKVEKVGCYINGKIQYPHCPFLKGLPMENIDKRKREINEQIEEIKEKIRIIEERSRYRDYFEVDLGKISEKISRIKEDLERTSEDYETVVNKISEVSREIGNLEDKLDKHYSSEKEIKEIEEKVEKVEKKMKLYEEAVEILGKDKLPFYLVETYIPMLENIANDYMKMCETSYSIRFLTEGKRDNTLEIYVDTPQGELEVTELCGYEQTLVKIILRLSLLSLLRNRGINYEFIVIDEAFDNVDTQNTHKIWEMIRMSNLQVIYVSHRDDVIDLADEIMEVQNVL